MLQVESKQVYFCPNLDDAILKVGKWRWEKPKCCFDVGQVYKKQFCIYRPYKQPMQDISAAKVCIQTLDNSRTQLMHCNYCPKQNTIAKKLRSGTKAKRLLTSNFFIIVCLFLIKAYKPISILRIILCYRTRLRKF